jgi:hypothetical protein
MQFGRRRRGGCNWVVKWLYAAAFAVVAVGCGDDTPAGSGDDASGIVRNGAGVPRLLAPLSGSVSGSRQPELSYAGPSSARVDLCYDRGCTHLLRSLNGTDGHAQPDTALPAGTFFWRAVARHRTSATWQLVIPSRESGLTTASATVPDYNGDGRADIAIGAPAAGSGSVPIFFGSFFGVSSTADVTLTGGDQFGRAIAAVGDVNGDGFVDLAVASGGDPGTVNIYDGGPAGPTMGNALRPGPITAGFGTTMASAGDVDGDGYGDVIVGGREAAQIFMGSAKGMAVTPVFTLTGQPGGDALFVQGPADVNGDGLPDVLVGGVLYLGNGHGFTPQTNFTPFGRSGIAGDYDDDGLTDIAADQAVLPGTPDGVDPNRFLLIQAGESIFESAGDIDGDGYADVLAIIGNFVGVPEKERVYFGAPTSCGATDCRAFSPLFVVGHDQTPSSMTAVIAAAGDLNGDGGDDLVVLTLEDGAVWIYLAGGAREQPLANALRPAVTAVGGSLAGLFGTAPQPF